MTQVRKAVITAAGRGTRQYPATNTVQKELFPLIDVDGFAKPTLQIIVEEALGSGIEELCVIANGVNAEPIRHHFRGLTAAQRAGTFQGKEWAFTLSDTLEDIGRRLTLIVQDAQEGFGHAVYQARAWVGDEPFVLLLGDHVYRSAVRERCARQVIGAFEANGCPVSSVSRVSEASIPRLGVIAGRPLTGTPPALYEIGRMTEKPTLEYARAHLKTPGLADGLYLSFFGIHVFSPSIFGCLKHLIDNDIRQKGEIQLTAALELLHERERYLVSEVSGERFDMGVPEGLVETQIALALHSPYRQQARAMLAGHSTE